MVAVIGAVPLLVAVNAGTDPVPLAARPMAVLELVHAKLTAGAGVPVKVVAGTEAPLQAEKFAGMVTVGAGLMVILAVALVAAHPPEATMLLVIV